jgi:hypothetical protein
MTQLDFKTAFKSSELQQLDIPVEVRSSNLALVGRTTSSQQLSVDPGDYYVSAILPSGHELSAYVEAKGESKVVELAPEPGEESPAEWMEPAHFLTTQTADIPLESEPSLEPLGPHESREISLRWISGNLFTGSIDVQDFDQFEPNEQQHAPTPIETGKPKLVQLRQPGLAPLTVAAPSPPGRPAKVALARQQEGHWALDVQLDNPAANLLLHYRARGYAQQAADAIDSPQFEAEELLREKINDPIAAAVGAYALLRFADLERLHDWTENLCNWFEWFPDGASIVGEHFARLGRHTDALNAFVSLAQRGIPLFTDGFSFTLDRLRLYLETETMQISPATRASAERILETLKRLASFVELGQPILTISGDPLELLQPGGPVTPSVSPDAQTEAAAPAMH